MDGAGGLTVRSAAVGQSAEAVSHSQMTLGAGRLTLHVRLTRACNADCSYCSSHTEDLQSAMTPVQYETACRFIIDRVLPILGFGRSKPAQHISIQYLGGEILTLRDADLRACVLQARDMFGRVFDQVHDGVQSNLVASDRKVARLATLFGRNIGTSVDHFSQARTVSGSAERYRELWQKARARLRRRGGFVPSAVFVVDREGVGHVADEIAMAEADGYHLTLRPVFEGGREVDPAGQAEMVSALADAFDRWVMTSTIILEPYFHLLQKRVARALRDPDLAAGHLTACQFQRNCAGVSLNLDPDGALYQCQEMADSGQLCLGNALTGVFDQTLWQRMADRVHHIDHNCRVCPWQSECQGGCMSEALHHTGDLYGRTELCAVWTALFQRMDAALDRYGAQAIAGWLKRMTGDTRA